jgi:hypothetical protein
VLQLRLERFAYAPDGTFGRLLIPGDHPDLFTCERPWLNNAPNVSCIPEGYYPLADRRFFRKGYDAIAVQRVPGRDHILIHKANWPHELEGCIAVGVSWGCVGERIGVASSGAAFAELMEWWNQHQEDGGVELLIAGPPPAAINPSGLAP